MRAFIAAVLSCVTMYVGQQIGLTGLEDVGVGIVIGWGASGPVTTALWDGNHQRKKLPK